MKLVAEFVVSDGQDPLTAPLVDYLDRQYGIPLSHIRRVQLDSEVGNVQTVTVTLLVQKESE